MAAKKSSELDENREIVVDGVNRFKKRAHEIHEMADKLHRKMAALHLETVATRQRAQAARKKAQASRNEVSKAAPRSKRKAS